MKVSMETKQQLFHEGVQVFPREEETRNHDMNSIQVLRQFQSEQTVWCMERTKQITKWKQAGKNNVQGQYLRLK